MRPSIRAGIVVTGGVAFLFALALQASADVVDPRSPFQPVSTSLQEGPPKPITSAPEQAPDQGQEPAAAPEMTDPTTATREDIANLPHNTPAPEQMITRATPVRTSSHARQEAQQAASPPVERVIGVAARGLADVGVFLQRVASACQVGLASGAGGPALVLAVLGLVTALDRRWVLRTRLVTDEETPEFLYAWDVIAPG